MFNDKLEEIYKELALMDKSAYNLSPSDRRSWQVTRIDFMIRLLELNLQAQLVKARGVDI